MADELNENTVNYWFAQDKGQAHSFIWDTVKKVIENSARLNKIRDALNYYSAKGLRMGVQNSALSTNTSRAPASSLFYLGPDGRLQYNIIRPIIDALCAKIAAEKPRPKYIVKGGDFKADRLGMKLDTFSSGQFYKHKIFQLNQKVFVDACLHGAGFMHIHPDVEKNDLLAEHAWAGQIWVDEYEAKYGEPRNLYRVIDVDKYWLAQKYPKFADAIKKSGLVIKDGIESDIRKVMYDPCTLIVSYHLPAFPEAGDGRYVISTESCTIADDSWEFDDLPFAKFSLTNDPLGFYGTSVVDILSSIQNDITYFTQQIQAHVSRMSATLLINDEAEVTVEEIANNRDMKAIRIRKGGTQVAEWLITPADPINTWLMHIKELENRAYNVLGLSEDFAHSQKPAGLESGEAQRVYHDIQTLRYKHVAQRWEQYNLDISSRMVDGARWISSHGEGDYRILAESENKLLEISWKDVDLDKDSYIIKCFPTSILPDTPAGALQAIQELSMAMPELQPYLPMLLQYPDLQSVVQRNYSPQLNARRVVDSIIVDGKRIDPDDNWNLDVMLKEAQLGYEDACVRDVSDDRMQLLRDFISNCKVLQEAIIQKQLANAIAKRDALAMEAQTNQPAGGQPAQAQPATQAPVGQEPVI